MVVIVLRRAFLILAICCCGCALAYVNRGIPRISSRPASFLMSFPQQDRYLYNHQLNRRKINQKSSSNTIQSTTLGKKSELTTATKDGPASSSSGLSSNARSRSTVSSGGDDYGPRRALKTTALPIDFLAQAHELKITVGPDTTASSYCYFEKHHPCAGSTKSGVCPVDGRPCGSNRSYIDHLYNNKQHPLSSYQGGENGPHLSDRGAANLRQRGSSPSQQSYYNSPESSQNKAVSNQEVNRLIDDRRRQQRQQHLSAYFSQDPLEEIRPPLPAIPTEYPARFIYDIVDTFKVAMHVGKLVLSIVVAMLSDTVNKNFRFYQHGPDNMDNRSNSNEK